jgi:hypothetical protein
LVSGGHPWIEPGGFPCGIAHRAQDIELVEHRGSADRADPRAVFPHGAENIDFIRYKNCAEGIRSVTAPLP